MAMATAVMVVVVVMVEEEGEEDKVVATSRREKERPEYSCMVPDEERMPGGGKTGGRFGQRRP